MTEEDAYRTIRELLYNLNRDELRSIAWDCLLISDGPDKVGGEVGNRFDVQCEEIGHGAKFVLESEEY